MSDLTNYAEDYVFSLVQSCSRLPRRGHGKTELGCGSPKSNIDRTNSEHPTTLSLTLFQSYCFEEKQPWGWMTNQAEAVFHSLQEDLAKRSKYGELRKAGRSGHYIQRDQPELVTQAIQDVIRQSEALTASKPMPH
jgi:hypothetical protein